MHSSLQKRRNVKMNLPDKPFLQREHGRESPSGFHLLPVSLSMPFPGLTPIRELSALDYSDLLIDR
jgi:hypothetical protein